MCIQELTLSRYFAGDPGGPRERGRSPRSCRAGARTLRGEGRARSGVHVHASLYERAGEGELGYNTAIIVAPDGTLMARTRKLHIPVTAGYHEDRYFQPGPADGRRSQS